MCVCVCVCVCVFVCISARSWYLIVVQQIVQNLAEQYPELRGKRDELLAAIRAELGSESDSEGDHEFHTGHRELAVDDMEGDFQDEEESSTVLVETKR